MHGKCWCLVHGQANPRVCVLYMRFSLVGSGIFCRLCNIRQKIRSPWYGMLMQGRIIGGLAGC